MPDRNQDGEMRENESIPNNAEQNTPASFMNELNQEDLQQVPQSLQNDAFQIPVDLTVNMDENAAGSSMEGNAETPNYQTEQPRQYQQGSSFQPQQAAQSGHYIARRDEVPRRSFFKRVNRGVILIILCFLIVFVLGFAEMANNRAQNREIKNLYETIEPAILQSLFPDEEYSKALSTAKRPPSKEEQGYEPLPQEDLVVDVGDNEYLNKKVDELKETFKNSFISETDKDNVINEIVSSSYAFNFFKADRYVKEYSIDSEIDSMYSYNDGVAQVNMAKSISYTYSELGESGSSASTIKLLFKFLVYEVDGEWKIAALDVDRYDPLYFKSGINRSGGYY